MKSREHVTTDGRAAFYACIWNDLRQAAMDKGWALGLHGSLANDMDIMAMPWTEEAVSPDEMIEVLKSCFTDNHLIGNLKQERGQRIIYTLSIWADFYLDVSVIKTEQVGWEASFVECDLCGNRWAAARPAGTPKLECPNCNNISNFKEIPQP